MRRHGPSRSVGPGLSVHLNCIGKGYALDRMAEVFDRRESATICSHGGRSSVLARGNRPGDADPGWVIGLPHPLVPGERLGMPLW